MRLFNKNITMVVLFFGFLLITYVLYSILVFFIDLKPEVKAAIITALISVGGLIWSKQVEKNKEIASAHRQYKAIIYEKFINFVFNELFMSEKLTGKQANDKDILMAITDFNSKVISWGSEGVINEWKKFKDNSIKNIGAPVDQVILQSLNLESLIYAIRRDLGHKDKLLKKMDLLPLFLDDSTVLAVKHGVERRL